MIFSHNTWWNWLRVRRQIGHSMQNIHEDNQPHWLTGGDQSTDLRSPSRGRPRWKGSHAAIHRDHILSLWPEQWGNNSTLNSHSHIRSLHQRRNNQALITNSEMQLRRIQKFALSRLGDLIVDVTVHTFPKTQQLSLKTILTLDLTLSFLHHRPFMNGKSPATITFTRGLACRDVCGAWVSYISMIWKT
jgi:hypothetical protein